MTALPAGFRAHVANIGIKDATDDFVVIAADHACSAAGVFTQEPLRRTERRGQPRAPRRRTRLRAFVVISKNANVATGPQGLADAHEVVGGVAARHRLRCRRRADRVDRRDRPPLPDGRVRADLAGLAAPFTGRRGRAGGAGIMTTDTFAKVASRRSAGAATVVGIAKGVGMIEPDMATLIALFLTDAVHRQRGSRRDLPSGDRSHLQRVSIDTDTSTSDTAAIMASGAAGAVDLADFEAAVHAVALSLTKQIARDGEGATKLIEVTVDGARDDAQAKRVAKAIVNSPLVKTAVHGADPNWGRVAMAIGKCTDDTDIDQEHVVIRFGAQEVYPRPVDDAGLAALTEYMAGDDVTIHVSLGIADGAFTVWGCDLTDGYVRINADYTT